MMMMYLQQTNRFWVLTTSDPSSDSREVSPPTKKNDTNGPIVPTLALSRLLGASSDNSVRQELLQSLQDYGFVVLTLPRHSAPARIIHDMQDSLHRDFFPDNDNSSFQGTGDHVYVSEKGIPMWKVGYELTEDQVREAFRVAAGCPDSGLPWPTPTARHTWLRGLALCRHVCDVALQLTTSTSIVPMKKRPGSGGATWKKPDYSHTKEGALRDRTGDYSVLYAMHYFNQPETPIVGQEGAVRINVKQHVDPSLFVLEPFLADEPGLQVWSQNQWITCDGVNSPIHSVLSDGEDVGMVLFVGKAFANHTMNGCNSIEPTLHRVIAANSGRRRRTMIYEQKYEEFFPAPSFD